VTENQPPVEGVRPPDPAAAQAAADPALRAAVVELERYVAADGWDQPARLFALVRTQQLLADQPQLAGTLGIAPDTDVRGTLTTVEQAEVPTEQPLEELLGQMMWPDEVHGTAAAVERLVLPPSVGELPEDPAEAQRMAETHPDRQEVRMVAGATRSGATYCALRLRTHDDDLAVLEGPDLVPALLELLQATLVPGEQ